MSFGSASLGTNTLTPYPPDVLKVNVRSSLEDVFAVDKTRVSCASVNPVKELCRQRANKVTEAIGVYETSAKLTNDPPVLVSYQPKKT